MYSFYYFIYFLFSDHFYFLFSTFPYIYIYIFFFSFHSVHLSFSDLKLLRNLTWCVSSTYEIGKPGRTVVRRRPSPLEFWTRQKQHAVQSTR